MLKQETHDTRFYDNGDRLDLGPLIQAVASRWYLVAGVVAITFAVAVVVNFLEPNRYLGVATVLPVEKDRSNPLAAMMGAAGGGLGSVVLQTGFGGRGASTKLMVVLQTRTMAEKIIAQLNLKPELFPELWDGNTRQWLPGAEPAEPSTQEAVRKLRDRLRITAELKTEVVSIGFESKDPKVAAQVANAYVAGLKDFLQNNSLSAARRNRVFVESQLKTARSDLARYEVAFKEFGQRHRVVSITEQTESAVRAYADLKAQLMAAEVRLQVLKGSNFEDDPSIRQQVVQVQELKRQLNAFDSTGSGPMIALREAPALGLEYARLKRELLVREKVSELLTQQYHLARIQEAQEDISFQVLDPAIPPERKSGPFRTFNVLLAFVVSTIVGLLLALLAEFWSRRRRRVSLDLTGHPSGPALSEETRGAVTR